MDESEVCLIFGKALGYLLDNNEGVVVEHDDRVRVVACIGNTIQIVHMPNITKEHVGQVCTLCEDKEEAVTKAAIDPNGEVP